MVSWIIQLRVGGTDGESVPFAVRIAGLPSAGGKGRSNHGGSDISGDDGGTDTLGQHKPHLAVFYFFVTLEQPQNILILEVGGDGGGQSSFFNQPELAGSVVLAPVAQ
jgi:hypothetical protein